MVGGTALKIKVDENEVDKLNKVKKYVSSVEPTKRAALGDLQNRVLRPISGKEAPQKETQKETNLQAVLRNAKARVDTGMKKGLVAGGTKSTTGGVLPPVNGNDTNSRKIVTRSNSMRLGLNAAKNNVGTTAVTNVASGLQRHGSLLMANSKPKILTTKVVETKVQQVKYVTKSTKVTEKVVIEPVLRREDSNLSRRSLTKIKAALTREVATKTTSSTTRAITGSGSIIPSIRKKTTSSSSSSVSSSTSVNNAKFATNAAIAASIMSCKSTSSENLYLSPALSGIEDIDANDGENLLLVSEYAKDIYDYLYSLEDEHFIRPNHLEGQLEVQAKMRGVLIDWINEVHLQFHLAPETYQMSVAIIDRYLQLVNDTKRSQLQLVGVTALFIAAKYEELFPPSIVDFVYITDDTYTAKQILQMELKIFKTLDCNLSRPLPINFLRRFSKAAKAEDMHHTMAKYFLELASVEYSMAHFKPSEIAAASLFLSLQLLKGESSVPTGFNNSLWCPTMQFYSRYTADHLRPIARKIAAMVRNAPFAKLKAVYTKYQSSSYHKIAVRPELSGPLMDSLIESKD